MCREHLGISRGSATIESRDATGHLSLADRGGVLGVGGAAAGDCPLNRLIWQRCQMLPSLKQNLMESADCEPTSASCRSLPPALLCVNSGPVPPRWGRFFARRNHGTFLLALAIVNRRLQRCPQAAATCWAAAPLSSGLCRVGGPGAAPPGRRDRYLLMFVGGADDLAAGDAALLSSSPASRAACLASGDSDATLTARCASIFSMLSSRAAALTPPTGRPPFGFVAG
jgi:hypothetical protein